MVIRLKLNRLPLCLCIGFFLSDIYIVFYPSGICQVATDTNYRTLLPDKITDTYVSDTCCELRFWRMIFAAYSHVVRRVKVPCSRVLSSPW